MAGKRQAQKPEDASADTRKARGEDHGEDQQGKVDENSEVDSSIMGDVSEDIFFDLADTFIELANQHSKRLPVESISAALMYAASRYNAFLAVSEAPVDRLEPETAADYYSLQYRKMFEDNLDEYVEQQDAAPDADSA